MLDTTKRPSASAAETNVVMIAVTPTAGPRGRRGYFDASLADGRVLVRASRQPFLDAARQLLDLGYDPTAVLSSGDLTAKIGVAAINSPKRRRNCSSSISSIDSAPSRIAALNSSLSEAHSLGLASRDVSASKRTYTLLELAAACCSAPSPWNWSFMSERICCVVASPKTESRSAAAVAVTANTTMSWSVKSTVSIMGLHTLP